MDETRLNRLREELDKAQKKRQELDAKVKKLEQRVREAENTYIHDIVHAANITPEQLGRLIRMAEHRLPMNYSSFEKEEKDNDEG